MTGAIADVDATQPAATTMAAAVARWYFNGTSEVHVDTPFPSNPTCGYGTHAPRCDNCPNAGLGSNCLWDAAAERFHGLAQQ